MERVINFNKICSDCNTHHHKAKCAEYGCDEVWKLRNKVVELENLNQPFIEVYIHQIINQAHNIVRTLKEVPEYE